MLSRVDRALMEFVHELDRTGESVVYTPERDPEIQEFNKVIGQQFRDERKRRAN